VQSFERVPPRASKPEALPLREGGVYLLLGGFGTLGTAHAKALAGKVKAKLVLASRTALPERSGWDAWLASHGEADAVSRRIQKVRALEAQGAEVHVVAADVGDRTQLQAAVDAAVSRFGTLNGVVYAAGDVDPALFRAIPDTRPEDVRNHFRSRIQGVYALEEALAGRTLDFVHLASSLAAVLGGLGLASYTAATGFMDAFAAKHTQESPVAWTSVGWDAWRFEEGSASPLAAATPFGALAISADEGAQAFEHLLALGPVGHVAVSTSSLSARAARWTRPEQKEEKPQGALVQQDAGAEDRTPRPSLQNPYVAPRDELEETIARLWESTLGIAQVGVHDSFFELGGNSLVGVKLIARVREKFGVSIPAVSLYEGPTVHALAKLIKQATVPPDAAPAEEEDTSMDRGARRRARRARRSDSSEETSEEET
jgi:NAD(P)-dependent dehydrogenase (short-subunit alcohol dehydrogenase family)/acyl carrier protein